MTRIIALTILPPIFCAIIFYAGTQYGWNLKDKSEGTVIESAFDWGRLRGIEETTRMWRGSQKQD